MKKWLTAIAFATVASITLAGCGQNTAAPASADQSAKSAAQQTTAQTKQDSTASATDTNTAAQQPQNVNLVVEPGMKLGPDGKLHDAFINGDFTVTVGQPVKLTIYNYDDGTHTLTASDLNLDVKVQGSKKKGEPGVTTVTFTPTKTGTFNWICKDPCDGENNQWAMAHQGYMQGKITVTDQKVQHVSMVINAGYKLGPDGKLHDAFTPGNFTVNSGEPVELTIFNFDDGKHTFTAPGLNVNAQISGSTKKGEPSITKVTFTPQKSGKFQWNCTLKCDGENQEWAMSHNDYMMGDVTVK
ncbi:hypothetical protein LSG31_07770 [Fodinisporobacter ferrooxydans]|uniref:EfeO-type cupredoxin-like domain-containing protein n=1 Tax=Fodinisporobacter ferrooxydans TaxID=2901836 RepID=A0ABY4CS72_9BACL|nr:hypothetical protein LSG31_07770 [Alicyclobacillaceae bacterium MYW30-H2]